MFICVHFLSILLCPQKVAVFLERFPIAITGNCVIITKKVNFDT